MGKELPIGQIAVGPEFREVPGYYFLSAVRYARRVSAQVAKGVGPRSIYVYNGGRCFLSQDQDTGFAVTDDGELISLFNIGGKGRGRLAMQKAVEEGALDLECGEELIPYYRQFGFKVTGVAMSLRDTPF